MEEVRENKGCFQEESVARKEKDRKIYDVIQALIDLCLESKREAHIHIYPHGYDGRCSYHYEVKNDYGAQEVSNTYKTHLGPYKS